MFYFLEKLCGFLKWKVWDFKNPYEKMPYGITVFCSDAGSGKTISAVEHLLKAKEKGCYVYSNIDICFQDGKIKNIEDIINLPKNSVILIDEINLILNSRAWQNTDPQLLYLLTQHRKSGKKILATAQSFDHIDKQVRDFCTEVVQVSNIWDRWIFQRAFMREDYKVVESKQLINDEVQNIWERGKLAWRYSFIATNKLRFMYDSFQIADFFEDEKKVDIEKEKKIVSHKKLSTKSFY